MGQVAGALQVPLLQAVPPIMPLAQAGVQAVQLAPQKAVVLHGLHRLEVSVGQ